MTTVAEKALRKPSLQTLQSVECSTGSSSLISLVSLDAGNQFGERRFQLRADQSHVISRCYQLIYNQHTCNSFWMWPTWVVYAITDGGETRSRFLYRTRNLHRCRWPKSCGLIGRLCLEVSGTKKTCTEQRMCYIRCKLLVQVFCIQVSWPCLTPFRLLITVLMHSK